MASPPSANNRAGCYVQQPNGYRAFIPTSPPPTLPPATIAPDPMPYPAPQRPAKGAPIALCRSVLPPPCRARAWF